MNCILSRCGKVIPQVRAKRKKTVTCSDECAKIHNQNVQTKHRAKVMGSKTAVCKACSKLIVVATRKNGHCQTCSTGGLDSVKAGDIVEAGGHKFSVAEVLDQPNKVSDKITAIHKSVLSCSPITDTGYIMTRTRVYLGQNWETA